MIFKGVHKIHIQVVRNVACPILAISLEHQIDNWRIRREVEKLRHIFQANPDVACYITQLQRAGNTEQGRQSNHVENISTDSDTIGCVSAVIEVCRSDEHRSE